MTIQLSKFTENVLKNIANFNGGVIIKRTQFDKTLIESVSLDTDLFLDVEIPEKFEHDFIVSNLSKFLGIMSTLDSPVLELHKAYVDIKSGTGDISVKYCYADPRAVVVPAGKLQTGNELVTVDISKEKFDNIIKQASILQLPHIQFDVVNSKLVCVVKDCDNPSSNTITHDLGDAGDIVIDEDVVILANSLKIIPDDYQITVCEYCVALKPLNNRSMTYNVSRIMG